MCGQGSALWPRPHGQDGAEPDASAAVPPGSMGLSEPLGKASIARPRLSLIVRFFLNRLHAPSWPEKAVGRVSPCRLRERKPACTGDTEIVFFDDVENFDS